MIATVQFTWSLFIPCVLYTSTAERHMYTQFITVVFLNIVFVSRVRAPNLVYIIYSI